MKEFIIIPSFILIAGFGSYAELNNVPYEEQINIEEQADKQYYDSDESEEIIEVPGDHHRPDMPKKATEKPKNQYA